MLFSAVSMLTTSLATLASLPLAAALPIYQDSPAAALPIFLDLSATDTPALLQQRDAGSKPACNASCVYSLLQKTSYASAAVGIALTMTEYDSIDWCMSPDNVGWCPPTIEAVLDDISNGVATHVPNNQSRTNNCGHDCLRSNMERVSSDAAALGMLWAKHRVSGYRKWQEGDGQVPDKVDWSIRLLAGDDELGAQLRNVTEGREKRGLGHWLRGLSARTPASTASKSKPTPVSSVTQAPSPSPVASEPASLWEPRLQYLLGTPSRLRQDNWLQYSEIRDEFGAILRATESADAIKLESSWMRYMMQHWLAGPPTARPEQYADWMQREAHLDLGRTTFPDEAMNKIRNVNISSYVWRWVEDVDSQRVMDPWEGRPDSAKPNVLLRGFMMQFKDAVTDQGVPEPDGWSHSGLIAATLRPVWPFERTPGPQQANLRRIHTNPLTPNPLGTEQTAWLLMNNHHQEIPTHNLSMGLLLDVPTVTPVTMYPDTTIWGDKIYREGNATKWCDSSCISSTMRNVSQEAALNGASAVLTVHGGMESCKNSRNGWCMRNVSTVASIAARVARKHGTWKAGVCLDSECQLNATIEAAYYAEAISMVLLHKTLAPHLNVTRAKKFVKSFVVGATVASRLGELKTLAKAEGGQPISIEVISGEDKREELAHLVKAPVADGRTLVAGGMSNQSLLAEVQRVVNATRQANLFHGNTTIGPGGGGIVTEPNPPLDDDEEYTDEVFDEPSDGDVSVTDVEWIPASDDSLQELDRIASRPAPEHVQDWVRDNVELNADPNFEWEALELDDVRSIRLTPEIPDGPRVEYGPDALPDPEFWAVTVDDGVYDANGDPTGWLRGYEFPDDGAARLTGRWTWDRYQAWV